jgi:hypothetical protein
MSKKQLTPEQYAKLKDNDTLGYYPIYKAWRTWKEREYETCDLGHEHYMGWVEHKEPVGEPIAYKRRKPTAGDELALYYGKRMLESSNANTVFNDTSGTSKTIILTKHSPLVEPWEGDT